MTPEAVHDILKKTPKRLLFSDNWSVSTLDGEEEALFRLIVDEKGEIGLSTARTSVDAGNGKKKNEYLSGPLVKVADKVVYVNYHRRFAVIGGDFIGGKEPLRLGFRFDGEEIGKMVNQAGIRGAALKKHRLSDTGWGTKGMESCVVCDTGTGKARACRG